MSLPVFQQVTVSTSARLHMGFYDLQSAGDFGSVGLMLDEPVTTLTLARGVGHRCDEEVQAILEQLCQAMRIETPIRLEVTAAIPRHTGLGSGTQLAMAIGAGLNALLDLGFNAQQIASMVGRGRRSGIGIGAFQQGGFLVDAGKTKDGLAPAVMERADFPENWRIVLVQDSAHVGVHGKAEKRAFQTLNPANGNLREMVFSQMLVALKRADLLTFGTCMADLQVYNGNYFAPVQGGQYASKDVEQVLQGLQSIGAKCVGQSSWGPTGFAIVENESVAADICGQARRLFGIKQNIGFSICRGRNHGANINKG